MPPDHYQIQSLASGEYLPEKYPTKDQAVHAHRTRFGAARQGAYRVVRFPGVAPDHGHDFVPVLEGVELFGGPDA